MAIKGHAKPYSHTMGEGEFTSILRDLFNEEFDIQWDIDNKEYRFYNIIDWDNNLEARCKNFYDKYKERFEHIIIEYVYFDPITLQEIYFDKTTNGHRW